MSCVECGHATREKSEFRGRYREDLHCGHPGAGHRRGWIVETSVCGVLQERPAPAWCPKGALSQSPEVETAAREASRGCTGGPPRASANTIECGFGGAVNGN